jgi:hypothetical protein
MKIKYQISEQELRNAGLSAGVEPKNIGTLTEEQAKQRAKLGKAILTKVTTEITCTPNAADGDTCKTTVTEDYCQFVDDGHGGHWVCYKIQKQLTGKYDASRGCCAVVDPDNGGEYCEKPE